MPRLQAAGEADGGATGLLMALLVKIGIISEQSKVCINRFFSNYFVTVRDKGTTCSTFKKRYNDPNMAVKMMMRGLLEGLISEVSCCLATCSAPDPM